MSFRIPALTAASAALLVISLSAADWPQFLGPTANGISPEIGINKNWGTKAPTVLWNLTLGDRSFAGPAVADGIVYIISHDGNDDVVRALDIKTGTDVWRYRYACAPKDSEYGFARSTPVIANGKVYTLSQTGHLNCLDAKNGQKIWSHDLVAEFGGTGPRWQYSMSPFLDGEKLIVCPGGSGAAVVALNATTGATVWKGGKDDKAGYATPMVATIDGKRQYVIFSGTMVSGVDAENGSPLWSHPWKTEYDVNAAVPIAVGNQVLITSGYNHGSALLEIAAGQVKTVWENKAIISRFTSPIYVDGYVYCTGEQNGLVCMDFKTGQQKWKQPGYEWGGLVAADGVLIVMDGKSGDVAMINLSSTGYKELGRLKPLSGRSWTAPIVADQKLIVRSLQAIACLDLK